ncbi:MAG: hypothetical protein VKL39_12560 [Leptolyngbyaceae bacterium]|nr:hypothetical protein [Leptolyngbyaceae bacterium]
MVYLTQLKGKKMGHQGPGLRLTKRIEPESITHKAEPDSPEDEGSDHEHHEHLNTELPDTHLLDGSNDAAGKAIATITGRICDVIIRRRVND